MRQGAAKSRNNIWISLCAGLLFSCLIASIRSLILGLDIDEQYALTLAYRIAQGDGFLKEMWEPHQTSGLIPALFVKLYLILKGDSTYLLLYIRGVGLLLQGGLAYLWYTTFRKDFGEGTALLTALVLYLTAPKWIVMPEFANQQLGFWLMTIILLYRYGHSRKLITCILAGVSFCLCVMVYPSSILLAPLYLCWLWRRERKAAVAFLGTCVCIGLAFMGYLIATQGIKDILTGIPHLLSDPSHSEGASKLLRYGHELLEILQRVAIYCLLSLGAIVIHRGGRLKPAVRLTLWMLCFAAADQVRLWISGTVPHVHPQLHYLMLFILGGVIYAASGRQGDEPWRDIYILGWISSIIGFGGVLLLTNLDLKASFVHLLPGMLTALLYLGYKDNPEPEEKVIPWRTGFLTLWVCILLAARILLVRCDGGEPANILLVRQKVLNGAAKGVYADYMTGTQINQTDELLEGIIEPGERLWCIGTRNLITYVDQMAEVAACTTISTPVYHAESLKYYQENPEKTPNYILIDKAFLLQQGTVDEEVQDWIRSNYNKVTENTFAELLILNK